MPDRDATDDTPVTLAELIESWRAEHGRQPEGWDFAALDGRMREPDLSWDLAALYRVELRNADAVLDMGTGGGEFLLRFVDLLPTDTVATEGWEPNIPVARAALGPVGVDVISFGQPDDQADPEPMPFDDNRFSLILNRHESYHPAEIVRVLRPGGRFLTQQVGGDELGEIRSALVAGVPAPHVQYARFRDALTGAGLRVIDGAECVDHYEFADIAALVAYLRLVPWDAPEDFAVDRYIDALLRLHQCGPAEGRPLLATRKRFWLLAEKPG